MVGGVFLRGQVEGLFWVKEGRVFCFEGLVTEEGSARIYRLIQEFCPVVEIGKDLSVSCLEGAEECLQVEKDGEVVAVRQVGKVKIGNVHLLIRKIWTEARR